VDLSLSFALLVALITGSAFFSGAESAFTSLSPAQLAVVRSARGRRGVLVNELMMHPDRLLSTVLIGNNLMNVAASALATQITIRLFGNTAVGIMTGVLTLVMLIFAEVTPKQIAIANNEFICIHTARVIYGLSRVLAPLIVFIGGFSRFLASIGGGRRGHALTLDSILQVIRHAENVGILEQYKSRVVKNLFRFSDIPVSAVMTHRTEVVSMERNTTIAEAIRRVGETGHSRIPVYDRNPERIVGVAVSRELIRHLDQPEETIRSIMLDPVFVPEHRRIDQVMNQILREQLNLAIVLDEYGGLAGIVTLEDIVEEIIGEIYDEHETREGGKITPLGGGRYSIKAEIPLSVVNDFLPRPLETDNNDVHTLGGFLVERLGRIPSRSERIETSAGVFVVTGMRRNRLVELTWSRPADPTATGDRGTMAT
jgi:putative hemolysin